MKLKKILAAVAAAAVAVSTMAVSAFAIKDYPDGYTVDLIAEGYDVTAIAGFTVKISGDIDSGTGGGAGFNSATTGWDSTEWGNADAAKAINASDGEITIKRDAPVFMESDVTDPDNPYAQIWVQQWWGSDITIDSLTVFDKDGNELAKGAVDYTPAETEAEAAETEAAPEETTEAAPEETEAAPVETEAEVEDEDVDVDADEPEEEAEEPEEEVAPVETEAPAVEEAPAPETNTAPAQTGNVAVASIVAVMAVAGAATIVAKKRK
ncbi:MAG: hypothetical protein K2H90_07520 [Oscillospiraceae bacterium]|nr:hypothetical protein [Oscillospiraceae bacterium]